MNQAQTRPSKKSPSDTQQPESFVLSLWVVRYQVKDVARSADFYTQKLGFHLDQKTLPAFAQVSGSRPMRDGQAQQPGGWNRVVLQVADLPSRIETLKKSGLHFRNQMETGPIAVLFDVPRQPMRNIAAR